MGEGDLVAQEVILLGLFDAVGVIDAGAEPARIDGDHCLITTPVGDTGSADVELDIGPDLTSPYRVPQGDLTATMPTLVFTVVALDSSERDLWLAYDTDDHDARIRF